MHRSILSLVLLSVVVTAHPNPPPKTHAIELIGNNPGLYYERMDTVRFKRTIWQVVIFLEVETFLENHGPTKSFQDVHTKCKVLLHEDECDLALGKEIIELKHRRLESLHLGIKETMRTLGNEKPTSAPNPASIRTKRSPPLGIIGSLSKSLFGLVTSDDVELINRNIDELFKDQSSLVQLVDEQSHIVSAGMEELYNVTRAHEVRLSALEAGIKQRFNLLQKEEEKLKLNMQLLTYSRQIDAKLDHLISSTQSLLDILISLRQGKIHPSLLTSKILEQLKADIGRITGDLDLPIPTEHLRPEEMSSISGIDGVRKNGRVFAVLHVPLVDKTTYHLYKLHPVGVAQNLTNLANGIAYVQPSHPYLSISIDHQQFVKLSHENRGRCLTTHYAHICPTEQPLQDVTEVNECEVAMLLHPTMKDLSSCDIHLRTGMETQWTYLTSEEAWLFSAIGNTRIRVICPGHATQTVRLTGIGLLRLAANCIARTDRITLMHDQVKTDGLYYVYQPDIQLKLSEAIPAFEEHKDQLAQMKDEMQAAPIDWAKKGESLKTILGKMREISSHRRETNYTNTLVYSGLTCYAIFLIIILTVIIIRCRNKPQGSWVNPSERRPQRSYNVKTTNFSDVNPPFQLTTAGPSSPCKPPRQPESKSNELAATTDLTKYPM